MTTALRFRLAVLDRIYKPQHKREFIIPKHTELRNTDAAGLAGCGSGKVLYKVSELRKLLGVFL